MANHAHDGHRDSMKKKYIEHGYEQFREHELVEMLLYYAIARKDTNEIAHNLIKRFGNIHGIFNASYEQIEDVEGVGEHTAVLLKLCGDLVRHFGLKDHKTGTVLKSTDEIGEYLLPYFWGEQTEVLRMLTLDNCDRVLTVTEISHGLNNASDVNLKIIKHRAALDGATQVVLAHNHPQGFAFPSETDKLATAVICQELKKINVVLRDHLVISDTDFVSMFNTPQLTYLFL